MALQVLLPCSESGPLVAGLPSSLRTAQQASSALSPSRIVLCGQRRGFEQRWGRQLENLSSPALANGEPAASLLRSKEPLLVVSPAGFPDAQGLSGFVSRASASGKAARWVSAGRTVAVYYPQAAVLLDGRRTAAEVADLMLSAGQDLAEVDSPGWLAAADPTSAKQAETALCSRLPQDKDGYLAHLDRRLSIALSRLLLKTPVTPNQITAASLVLGLVGAAGLASGFYAWQLAGALVLWFCCILDGCDGEVARLKLLMSPSGAAFDLAADHLAHLAVFVAIPLGVHRAHPEARLLLPGVLLVSGFLASAFGVWRLILRIPEERRDTSTLFIERLASRDYTYLIVALTALGRLDWFLWAAGIGSHLFWLALWVRFRKAPTA